MANKIDTEVYIEDIKRQYTILKQQYKILEMLKDLGNNLNDNTDDITALQASINELTTKIYNTLNANKFVVKQVEGSTEEPTISFAVPTTDSNYNIYSTTDGLHFYKDNTNILDMNDTSIKAYQPVTFHNGASANDYLDIKVNPTTGILQVGGDDIQNMQVTPEGFSWTDENDEEAIELKFNYQLGKASMDIETSYGLIASFMSGLDTHDFEVDMTNAQVKVGDMIAHQYLNDDGTSIYNIPIVREVRTQSGIIDNFKSKLDMIVKRGCFYDDNVTAVYRLTIQAEIGTMSIYGFSALNSVPNNDIDDIVYLFLNSYVFIYDSTNPTIVTYRYIEKELVMSPTREDITGVPSLVLKPVPNLDRQSTAINVETAKALCDIGRFMDKFGVVYYLNGVVSEEYLFNNIDHTSGVYYINPTTGSVRYQAN